MLSSYTFDLQLYEQRKNFVLIILAKSSDAFTETLIDVTFHVSNNDKSPATESRKQTSREEEKEEKGEFYNLASEKKKIKERLASSFHGSNAKEN